MYRLNIIKKKQKRKTSARMNIWKSLRLSSLDPASFCGSLGGNNPPWYRASSGPSQQTLPIICNNTKWRRCNDPAKVRVHLFEVLWWDRAELWCWYLPIHRSHSACSPTLQVYTDHRMSLRDISRCTFRALMQSLYMHHSSGQMQPLPDFFKVKWLKCEQFL